jgi:16S rRNA (uracil1498-N3)-methyltransferase
MTRIFQSVPLAEHSLIELDESAHHHLAHVLRAKVGDEIIVFNGEGGEYTAIVQSITKKNITAQLNNFISRNAESALDLWLAQGISRGEKMDYTIQKAVELGVKKIIPLFTERCNVKLSEEKKQKRWQHWRSIIIHACEQSGRTSIPELVLPVDFAECGSFLFFFNC